MVPLLDECSIPYLLDFDIKESISSIKIMQGVFFLASSNNYLTLWAPNPTNISSKLEPVQYIKFTPDSPAIALASKVFPVPGGPDNKTPLKSLAPFYLYSFAFLIILTNWSSSSLISSIPLTSYNR